MIGKRLHIVVTVVLTTAMLASLWLFIIPHMHDGTPLTVGKVIAILMVPVAVLWAVFVRPAAARTIK